MTLNDLKMLEAWIDTQANPLRLIHQLIEDYNDLYDQAEELKAEVHDLKIQLQEATNDK